MAKKRTNYTHEYKVEAVRILIDSGKPLAVVAKELDVSAYLLNRWKRELQGDATTAGSKSPIKSRDEEILQLRRDLKRVSDERDFLKKTAAYFAKESK
jgi:transposase